MRRKSVYLRVLGAFFIAIALLPAQIAAAANPPVAGDVLINEYVANSSVTEWVELYNTTGVDLDISGYYIDDIAGGGGAPKVIPASTIIPANGFYVMEFSGFLNNGGDDVRFLDPLQVALDTTSYTSSTSEYSRYRITDGGTWSGIETDTPTKGATNNGTGDEPWVAGTFEIRIFDVEQGDSQLIIFPSGFSILIDVREASWNTGAGAALIAAKIQTITGGSHVNVGVLSHHHLDHMGYAGFGGFWGLLENEGITFDKIVDRDAGAWVDGSGGGVVDGLCDPDFEIVWHNAGTQSGTGRNWLCYATNSANTNIYPIREIAQLNSTTQINPPDANGLVKVVQVDGDGVTLVDGITPIQGDHTGDPVPPSENDYSIGLKIRFGLIDYATAGDSDGEYDTSQFGYTYNDVETIIAPRFGQVDILRANHHGSGHSTSQYYVDTLNPDASAISCGANAFGHPAQAVLDRLLSTGDLYLTNLCDATRNYGASVIVSGDIIIRSTNGLNYTVDGVAYVASDPLPPTPTPTNTSVPPTATPTPTDTPTATPTDTPTATPTPTDTPTPTATATNTPLPPTATPTNTPEPPTPTPTATTGGSMSDILINEVLPAPSSGAPEWIELYNPTSSSIDISGMWIDDIANGGGSAKQIPNGTIIPAGGYWTMDTSRFFNNSGDDARLLLPDGSTVVDSYTYGSSTHDLSWYRTPDGAAWSSTMTSNTTKGASNP